MLKKTKYEEAYLRLYRLISPLLFVIVIGLFIHNGFFVDNKSNISNINTKSIYADTLQKHIDNDSDPLKNMKAKNFDIVKAAYKEIGNVGGEKYWSYFGFSNHVSWCACFASWCADQCGLIDKGIIPRFTSVGYGYNWFIQNGLWLSGNDAPEPGMIIFFDYTDMELNDSRDGIPDHVGIVKNVKDGYVYCIEGNYNDTCQETEYIIGHHNILGYGTPKY